MSERPRYAAVVEANYRIDQTFVFEGSTTLDEIFNLIDDHRIGIDKVSEISVHRGLFELLERPSVVEDQPPD